MVGNVYYVGYDDGSNAVDGVGIGDGNDAVVCINIGDGDDAVVGVGIGDGLVLLLPTFSNRNQRDSELNIPASNLNLQPVSESPKLAARGRWSREGSLSRYSSLSFKMLRSRSKSKTREAESCERDLRRRTTIISDHGNEIYGFNVRDGLTVGDDLLTVGVWSDGVESS